MRGHRRAPVGGAAGPHARGTTSINGHIYNRGQAMDFDGWAQMGNRGWSHAEVLPYFMRCEGRIGEGEARWRGRRGPLKVTDLDWHHPLTEAFIEGASSTASRAIPITTAPGRRASAIFSVPFTRAGG